MTTKSSSFHEKRTIMYHLNSTKRNVRILSLHIFESSCAGFASTWLLVEGFASTFVTSLLCLVVVGCCQKGTCILLPYTSSSLTTCRQVKVSLAFYCFAFLYYYKVCFTFALLISCCLFYRHGPNRSIHSSTPGVEPVDDPRIVVGVSFRAASLRRFDCRSSLFASLSSR